MGAKSVRMLSIGTGSSHAARKSEKLKEGFDFNGRATPRFAEEMLDVFMQTQAHVADDLASDALGDNYLRIEPHFKNFKKQLPKLDDSESLSLGRIKQAGDVLWRAEGQRVLEFLKVA